MIGCEKSQPGGHVQESYDAYGYFTSAECKDVQVLNSFSFHFKEEVYAERVDNDVEERQHTQ